MRNSFSLCHPVGVFLTRINKPYKRKFAESALKDRKCLSFFLNTLLSLSLNGNKAKILKATLQHQHISGYY